MDITSSLAANTYAKTREIAAGGQSDKLGLRDLVQQFSDTLQHAEATAKDALVGKADPHAMVEALAQTQLAVETAVTLRDKVVEAYQEIIRMPI